MASSYFHIPGAFNPDTAGVYSGVYRPPTSPSSSTTSYLAGSSFVNIESNAKRKRNRDSNLYTQPRNSAISDFDVVSTPGANPYRRPYVLAGQIGTPGATPLFETITPVEDVYTETNYRSGLCAKRVQDEKVNSSPEPTPLFELPTQPRPAQGWGSTFASFGGVVGRVLDFCTAGAFRGFYAGGGKGYGITATATGHDAMMVDDYNDKHDDQRMPGYFPNHCSIEIGLRDDPDYYNGEQSSGATTPTRPAAKRRQTEDTDDLGRNWVVISESAREKKTRPRVLNRNHSPSVTTGRRKSTPAARLSTTPKPAAAPPKRPSSRLSTAQPASLNIPRPASSASFASPRSPSPSKIPMPVSNSYHSPSSNMPPRLSSSQSSASRRRSTMTPTTSGASSFSHRRTNSGASMASHRAPPPDDDEVIDASPRLDAEAKKLASRRLMEERNADYRIAAFNKQLQDMIRQGKEALGTTIEVDSMDGVWEDDD
ncbi:hypothetical protein B0I35DRAFT_406424 [Stachybotrys elegans]|uniref:Uncharacterized protein n=1 Tax=Stachybotrys elegans TaxID=80388 RepID=A0A8K0SXJ7_9HYPO|nr:hypothetical protein B0I35DRAFT_406424 [Stachybotrys elegans]